MPATDLEAIRTLAHQALDRLLAIDVLVSIEHDVDPGLPVPLDAIEVALAMDEAYQQANRDVLELQEHLGAMLTPEGRQVLAKLSGANGARELRGIIVACEVTARMVGNPSG